MIRGQINAYSNIKEFTTQNKRQHKIMIQKQRDSYDITVRVKETLKNFNFQILENSDEKIVVIFEKTKLFVDEIYEKLLQLEKNGDFGGVYFSKLELNDIIAPLFKGNKASFRDTNIMCNPFDQSVIGELENLDNMSVMTSNMGMGGVASLTG